MLPRRALRLLVPTVALAAATLLPGVARAEVAWAAPGDATVRPGAQTFADGAQCTANFVFEDSVGGVFIGQAAHCTGTGTSTDTNGCETGSLPVGTPVTVAGAEHPATLAYSSWVSMRRHGESDPSACQFNDFALLRLDPRDHQRVNPTVPVIGGPTGLADTTTFGSSVRSYGSSSLRFGLSALSPKYGVSLGTTDDGWTQSVLTFTPGIPGDSGSGFLNGRGEAVGVLSTLSLAPVPGSNGVTSLARALQYLNDSGDHAPVRLVRGT